MTRHTLKSHMLAGLSITGALASWLAAADEALIEAIPAEAIAVVHVKDAGQMGERFKSSILGNVWEDAKLRKFLAPVLDSFEEEVMNDAEVEAGLEAVQGAIETFEGEAVLSLIRFPFEAIIEEAESGAGFSDDPEVKSRRAEAMKKDMRLAALGKVAADGKAFSAKCQSIAEMLLEKIDGDDKGELVSEKVDGQELHTIRLTNPEIEDPFDTVTYAQVGDVGVVGFPRETVEEIVASLKSGLKGEKLTSGPFGTFQQRNEGNDLHLHLNIEPLMEVALRAAEQAEEAGMMGPQAAGMGLTVQSIYDALGLGDLQSLDVGFQFDQEAVILDSAIQYTKRSGLMNLIAYREGPMPKTSFIPHDAISATVSIFSFEDLWKSLIGMVEQAAPAMAPMVKQQLAAAEAQLGVSLEKDVFGAFKPEVITVQSSHPGEGEIPEDDMVVMLGLKNEQGFEVAWGKILGMVSGLAGITFEPSEFLGKKMHSIDIPAMGPGGNPQKLSYMFTEGYFVVSLGKGETLRKILSNMERPGKSLWDEAHVKAAVKRLDAGFSELSYMDLGSLASTMSDMFAAMLGEEEVGVNWDHLPTSQEWKALVGFVVGTVYVEKNGIFSKALLLPNGE